MRARERRDDGPLPLGAADFSAVRAVFTDVDGTLTTGGLVESATLASVEHLKRAGLAVVLVSGRPAGFGETWMREWPVDAAVVENGGLWFVRDGGRIEKRYAEGEGERDQNRRRLVKEVLRVMKRVEGVRLSSDSTYTEVDLALDYAEDASLGAEAATEIEGLLARRGVTAVRSSVHVNCWIGAFDKLTSTRRLAREELGLSLGGAKAVYVGDSFNDAPMFDAFALSVGVANVRDVLGTISHPPKFVARAREGAGFREAARAILGARGGR